LRSDKNQEKAKAGCFYQPTLPELLLQSRAGRALDFGVFSLFYFPPQADKEMKENEYPEIFK
jgi:hypothetical protein